MDTDLQETLQTMKDQLDAIQELLRLIARNRLPEKAERIREHTIRQGKIAVQEAEDLIGVSRTYAIQLMREIGEEPGFIFRIGDQGRNTTTMLIYDAGSKIIRQHEMIFALLRNQRTVSLSDLMNKFNITLPEARSFANEFISKHQQWDIIEGNKIAKKGATSNS